MLKRPVIATSLSWVLFSVPLAVATPEESLSPATASSTTAEPKVTKGEIDYRAGSVVTVFQLRQQGRNHYEQGHSIGSFVSQDNPWSLRLHQQQAALKFFEGEPLGYQVDGYFVAKEAGQYSFLAEVDLPPAEIFADPSRLKGKSSGRIDCRYQLTVANQTIVNFELSTKAKTTSKDERICGLTEHGIGIIQLEPGLHPVRQWFACSGKRKLKGLGTQQYSYPDGCKQGGKKLNTDSFPGDEAQVTIRIRHPQDNTPLLLKANELVHEKR